MPTKVDARPDRTLSVKRTIFSTLLRIAEQPAVQQLVARQTAPHDSDLALALGESLVMTPRRVLAFTAHPDDLEFFCGGTLRRMALAGSQIHAMVISDGEKRGNWTELGERRRLEQHRAAVLQGYRSINFLGLPDFGLPEDPRLELLLDRAWSQIDPDVVFGFDPKELVPGVANRDHKALGRTLMDLARARLHTRAQLYFYGTRHPDVLVDITPVMRDKIRAARAHRSQMVYLDEEETSGAFRLMGRVAAGRSACPYAEPLYRLM